MADPPFLAAMAHALPIPTSDLNCSTATADHCQIPSTPTAEEKEARAAYLQKQRERLVEKRRLDREKKAAAMQRAMVTSDGGGADTTNRVRAADRAWAEGKSGEATKLRQAITS